MFATISFGQTLVLSNYNENLIKDLDNNVVYSEKFVPASNTYTLNKIDNTGAITNLFSYTFATSTTQFNNNGGTGSSVFYNAEYPTYIKVGKAIVRFMQGTTATHLLFNGTSTALFTIPNSNQYASLHSNFILNANNAIIFDGSKIYQTDYTTAGTTLIFTSPNPKSSALGSIENLQIMQNKGGLYWIDIYNFEKSLYKRVNGVNTKILTVTGGDNLFMHQNKLNGEIFVTKQISSTTNKILIKIDNTGTETNLTIPTDAFPGNALALVNNKLIFSTLAGKWIAMDLTNNSISNVNTPKNFSNFGKTITTTNGSIGYFFSNDTNDVNSVKYFPYVFEGTTAKQIGGNMGLADLKGDFCGDNFYLNRSNATTFLGEIFKLTPTSCTIYLPNNVPNNSFKVGISNSTGIYSKSQLSVSPFTANLYKTACNNATNTNDNYFADKSINIFPNPSSGVFNLKIDDELIDSKVNIYNFLGQAIQTFRLTDSNYNGKLDKGLYLIEFVKDNNRISKKLIVN
jgi:Secretion system C-terminal sorting domain